MEQGQNDRRQAMLAESSARADPGAYESLIRDRLLSGFRYSPGWKTIPDDIQSRLASCVAASVVDVFPPEEVRQLDAAMSGGPNPDKTLKKLWHRGVDRVIEVMEKIVNNDLSVLEPICATDVEEFKNYSFPPRLVPRAE